jgi:hypothetical protein
MTILMLLLVVFIWLLFSVLYFSKEVSNFLTGGGKKLPMSSSTDMNLAANLGIFGGSRTDTAIFFAKESENTNKISDNKIDYSEKNAIFAKESENNNSNNGIEIDYNKKDAIFAEKNKVDDDDGLDDDSFNAGDDFADLTSMFDLEFENSDGNNNNNNNNDEDNDSGEAVSGEENVGVIKTFDELRKESFNVLKVIGGGDEASKEEKLQARKTLNELRGTDLFSQIESISGASKVELMRLELDKLWSEAYEAGDTGSEQMDIDF